MKCHQKTWLLRADPKDPNIPLGSNLYFHTIDENQKNAFVEEGLPLWTLNSHVRESSKMVRIRVKWVYTLECVDAQQIEVKS